MSEQPQFLYHYLVRSVLFGSPRHSAPVDHGGSVGPCVRLYRVEESESNPRNWRAAIDAEWVRFGDLVDLTSEQFDELLWFGLDERLDLWSGGAEMIARRLATGER